MLQEKQSQRNDKDALHVTVKFIFPTARIACRTVPMNTTVEKFYCFGCLVLCKLKTNQSECHVLHVFLVFFHLRKCPEDLFPLLASMLLFTSINHIHRSAILILCRTQGGKESPNKYLMLVLTKSGVGLLAFS